MVTSAPDATPLTWGPFELHRQARELWARGQRLPLDAGAVDVVIALTRRPGAALQLGALRADGAAGAAASRGEAEARVWSRVAAINAVLASVEPEGFYIAHFPGQGFVFVMPAKAVAISTPDLEVVDPEPGAVAQSSAGGFIDEPSVTAVASRPAAVAHHHGLPQRGLPIYGRDDLLLSLEAQLAQRRLITLVGPGGMGKSTVALALARRVSARFDDGAHLIELAPVADPRIVPNAVAGALGVGTLAQAPVPQLLAYLRDRKMLLVLDSCEHLVEAVARLSEQLLSEAPGLRIVATSREPLLVAGEWVHRVPPVGMPEHDDALTAVQALSYPALQLFVERARGASKSFVLDDQNAAAVAALCRRLDGIPLAIELAAARVAELGVARLASELASRMLTLSGGPRSAPFRHRTLAAMLDWSYALLADTERAVLNRLSVFRGRFTLAAAAAVASSADIAPGLVAASVLDLVAKSLLSVSPLGGESGFRLLDTTRAYALAKLSGSGDAVQARRQHASCLCSLLEDGEVSWGAMTRAEWRAHYTPWVDDVRAALVWAFSPDGDDELGIQLTIATYAMADQTGAMSDHSQFAEHALSLLAKMPVSRPHQEMRLMGFPANVHKHLTERPTRIEDLLRSLEAARATGTSHYQMARLVALWGHGFFLGNYPASLNWVEQMDRIASDHADPIAALIASRTRAQTLHFMGAHGPARLLAERVLLGAWQKIPLAYEPSPVGLNVSMRVMLARILWMQGFADQAEQMARDSVEHATGDSPAGLCQALAVAAVPIALWRGDVAAGRAWADQLGRHVRSHSYAHWESWWVFYEQVLGALESAHDPRFDTFLWPDSFDAKLRDQLGTFDPRFMANDAWERVEAGTVGWCAPEVLRIQAERVFSAPRVAPAALAEARALLLRAQALARQQGALAWELRVAISLARLRQREGRLREAHEGLRQTWARCTEGAGTADLRSAAALLAQLVSA